MRIGDTVSVQDLQRDDEFVFGQFEFRVVRPFGYYGDPTIHVVELPSWHGDDLELALDAEQPVELSWLEP